MKCVIYTRVSTDEQAEQGYSLPSQLEACRKYAKEHDYDILVEFSDDYSGREINRPGLDQLRDLLGKSKIDALIVYSADRLTRDLAHSIELRRELSLLDVELCKVLGGQFNDTPHGRFTENVVGAVSQLESEIIVERSQRGKNQRAKSGKMIMQGYPPFGYYRVGKGRDAEYRIDEKQSRIVKDIFNLYTVGNGVNGPMAIRAIAFHLNSIGAPTPNKSAKSITYWHPVSIRKILSNEIYAGRTYWGKTRMVNKKRIYQPRERWIVIEVPELAMIDRATFEAAQKRRDRNKQLAKRNRKKKYLMSGFFKCGACGSTMCGHFLHYESGNTAKYYRCGNHWRQFKDGKKCGLRSIDTVAYKIDDAVWSWIVGLLCDPESLEDGLQKMIEKRSREIAPKQERLLTLKELVEEEQRRIRRLINEMGNHDSELVMEAFRAEIEQTTKACEALGEEHSRLSNELAEIEITQDHRDQIMAFSAQVKDQLKVAGYEEKRRIMDILDVRIVMHYDEKGKWLEANCAIPAHNDVIELLPSAARPPDRATGGKPSAGREPCR